MKMLRLPGKQQQNSIRFQWLKAFLLIMIIAVFLNIVAYTFSINELEEQVAENGHHDLFARAGEFGFIFK